ncbi:unnamed protein product [Angiostrongylus costaricensis]|uniref:Uncharacterized protein n=1 Tax=Angiostrongylus costaricensis TaxID=334426 RepID=A0A0R3PTL9_ANGCS|nr:unnamed protein product [Angiostrongylus costaricensis]
MREHLIDTMCFKSYGIRVFSVGENAARNRPAERANASDTIVFPAFSYQSGIEFGRDVALCTSDSSELSGDRSPILPGGIISSAPAVRKLVPTETGEEWVDNGYDSSFSVISVIDANILDSDDGSIDRNGGRIPRDPYEHQGDSPEWRDC